MCVHTCEHCGCMHLCACVYPCAHTCLHVYYTSIRVCAKHICALWDACISVHEVHAFVCVCVHAHLCVCICMCVSPEQSIAGGVAVSLDQEGLWQHLCHGGRTSAGAHSQGHALDTGPLAAQCPACSSRVHGHLLRLPAQPRSQTCRGKLRAGGRGVGGSSLTAARAGLGPWSPLRKDGGCRAPTCSWETGHGGSV